MRFHPRRPRHTCRPLKSRPAILEPLEDRRLLTASFQQLNYFPTWEGVPQIIRSSDPADVAYDPRSGHLMLIDSEIDELPEIFNGDNMFEISLKGDTLYRSIASGNREPTGIVFNPFDGFWYVVNDDLRSLYRYDDTFSEPLASVRTTDSVANALDLEAVTVDPATGDIYVLDGEFGGLQILVYDAALQFKHNFRLGDHVTDANGIAFDPSTGHLFILTHHFMEEYTVHGDYLRSFDIDLLVPHIKTADGLAIAPTSNPDDDPSAMAFYIVDRGIDNFPDGGVHEAVLIGVSSNREPTVDAGPDQSLTSTMPAVITLTGAASDDGLPGVPAGLTTTWTQVSGPAPAIFANASALSTTVTLPASGVYVLRLRAADGEVSVKDDITIRLNGVIVQRQISHIDDDAEEQTSTTGVLLHSSGHLDLAHNVALDINQTVGLRFTDLAIPQGSYVSKAYIQFTTDKPTFDPVSLTITGQADDNATPFIKTDYNISLRPRTAASALWSPPAWDRAGVGGLDQRTVDISAIIQEIVQRPGWAAGNAIVLILEGTGQRRADSLDGNSSGAARLHVETLQLSAINQPPQVEAGPDNTLTLNDLAVDSVQLAGQITDDGSPFPPANVAITWSQVSGPGTATFSNVADMNARVRVSLPGTYVLRLTANDGEFSVSDELTLVVFENLAPVVNAGVDQTLLFNNLLTGTATLSGTASDIDGWPGNGVTSTTWSVVSGPGIVRFANPSVLNTTAKFSATGTYVLQLAASDGLKTGTDQVTVDVRVGLESRIAVGGNDAEEAKSGSRAVTLNSLTLDPAAELVGLRFTGLNIPRGATITNAYVQFEAAAASSNFALLNIEGENADNSAAFAAASRNISNRARTSASTLWIPSSWTAGAAGAAQRTPDIRSVIQAIVNRNGWNSGNALSLIIDGFNARSARSFEGRAAGAPLLHVEWAQSDLPPTVNAGVDQVVNVAGAAALAATLNGVVSDDGLPYETLTSTWSVVSGLGTVTFTNAAAAATTAQFSLPGQYVLRLTASDGNASRSDDLVIDVRRAVDNRISVGGNDAEEAKTTARTMTLNSTTLDFGAETVGLRFAGLSIPRGATINAAYVQFEAARTANTGTSLTIRGERSDNAAVFAATANNLSSRLTTTAGVSWNPTAWTLGQAGTTQRTPDLKAIVQEIVNRGGWTSGNSIALVVTGNGSRSAQSFEGKPGSAPLLHIEWSLIDLPPVVDAGADQTFLTANPASVVASLNGSAFDEGLPFGTLTTTWSAVSGPGSVTFANAAALATTAQFSAAGQYVLRLMASDGSATRSDDLVITVRQSLDTRISAGGNDVEEAKTSARTMLMNGTILDFGTDTIGLRFQDLNIPRGSTINAAYVQFEAARTNTTTADFTIRGERSDNSVPFASTANNLSSRPITTAGVSWRPAGWTVGQAGAAQRTPDLTAIVQEIVNRTGWATGNALALIFGGTGTRGGQTVEGKPSAAPLLHIEFTPPASSGGSSFAAAIFPAESTPASTAGSSPSNGGSTQQIATPSQTALPSSIASAPITLASFRQALLARRSSTTAAGPLQHSLDDVFRQIGE